MKSFIVESRQQHCLGTKVYWAPLLYSMER